MLIRSAGLKDLPQLLELSALLPPGMTSMPCDRTTWEQKLAAVATSLQEAATLDTERVYLLVMEEPDSGRIVGTAGLIAGIGATRPFYSYRLSTEVKVSEQLNLRRVSNLLHLVNAFDGETELVSLFLLPAYRSGQHGKLLSRCRFVFISDFPHRFGDFVFAEIRGWLDQHQRSPFWENLGRKFFNLPFAKADFISAVNGSRFISELMPEFPICLELLPREATDVVGKPHADAVPARKILEAEGFRFEGMVDIFDGGPVLRCQRDRIRAIRESREMQVQLLTGTADQHPSSDWYMVSNCRLGDYRLTSSRLRQVDEQTVSLPADTARLLRVEAGSRVRILRLTAPARPATAPAPAARHAS